jgi:shikimate kinase
MAQKDRKDIEPPVRNVFLTGFMCAGKSSAGRLLARRLGLRFADSDRMAERRAGMTIAELAARSGMAAFRKLETACVKELAAGRGRVVALGGGVYPSRRWRRALAGGVTVFLDLPWPELERRLRTARGPRPLLAGPWPKAAARAEKLLKKRLPYYRLADITVRAGGLKPAAAAEAIAKGLKNENIRF